jgi:hypothetical protein
MGGEGGGGRGEGIQGGSPIRHKQCVAFLQEREPAGTDTKQKHGKLGLHAIYSNGVRKHKGKGRSEIQGMSHRIGPLLVYRSVSRRRYDTGVQGKYIYFTLLLALARELASSAPYIPLLFVAD